MRKYRKCYLSEDLATVRAHPTFETGEREIALIVPHSKNQIINAYNFLSLSGGTGWTWEVYDEMHVFQFNFSGPQLANDVFSFVDYANHPLN